MGSSKRGSAMEQMINSALFGAESFNVNPSVNRERAITQMLERNITELAVNRFRWDNLPEGMEPRFIEMCLFFNALCVVYWDKDYDKILAVRGSGTGYVNMLDNPVSFTLIGPGAKIDPATPTEPAIYNNKTVSAYSPAAHKELDEAEKKMKAVPIWANYLRNPEIDIVRIYASRLAWIDRTLEINTKNARRNKVIKGNANMQLSRVNVARNMDLGDEIIQITGGLGDSEFMEAIDLGITPDSYDKLSILRTRVWNEAMGLLGIDNANQDKKERLVAAEVGANDSQTDSMRFVSLNARRYAVEQINDVFGLDIKVDFNVEVEAQEDAEKAAKNAAMTQEDGDTDGNVHDGTK